LACKRANRDICTANAALCMRVKCPTTDDDKKLLRLMKYLNRIKEDKLILSADDLHVIKWYVDASFAVHPDFKSHTLLLLPSAREHPTPCLVSKS
jgi:hypothetical protein